MKTRYISFNQVVNFRELLSNHICRARNINVTYLSLEYLRLTLSLTLSLKIFGFGDWCGGVTFEIWLLYIRVFEQLRHILSNRVLVLLVLEL